MTNDNLIAAAFGVVFIVSILAGIALEIVDQRRRSGRYAARQHAALTIRLAEQRARDARRWAEHLERL